MSEYFFDPKNIIKRKVQYEDDGAPVYYNVNGDDLFDYVDRSDFHIKTSEDEKTQTIICKHCGSDKFTVGTATYFTAVKCVNCNYEFCIHEG